MTAEAFHHYTAFGLTIRSCLPLPELLPTPDAASPDVEIVYGDVPAELPGVVKRGVRFQAAPDALRLQVDGIATYLIAGGRRITIARENGADDDDVRVFLLASAMGALLHQRDDLVLHGSAIEWNGEAVVFIGRSGAGKSTLAAAFRSRGHAVLTDDLCVVRPDATGRMIAFPGFPQTKLWLDSLRQLEISPEGLRRIRLKLEKRAVPLGNSFGARPRPVRKIYLLAPYNRGELVLTPVRGPQKFGVIRDQTYRFGFLSDIDSKAGHFQRGLRLAQQVPLDAVRRPNDVFLLAKLVETIEADLGS